MGQFLVNERVIRNGSRSCIHRCVFGVLFQPPLPVIGTTLVEHHVNRVFTRFRTFKDHC